VGDEGGESEGELVSEVEFVFLCLNLENREGIV